jgi:Fe2+ transport system protein FeoA
MYLNELKVGQSAVIRAVNGKGALRQRLLDMGLTPRTLVSVRKMAPLGDPIQIVLRGFDMTLRKEDAAHIEVEERAEEL